MSSSIELVHGFTPEQAAELTACAIPLDQAAGLGIRNADGFHDLPEHARNWLRGGDHKIFPALIFIWTAADGRTVEQVKPVAPLNVDDKKLKYLWPKGEPPIIHMAANPPEPKRCLVVEGTKQSRAAALYAPPDTRVVGLGGCFNWMEDGTTSPEIEDAMEGLPVTVILDADMFTNPMVWEAATRLDRVARQVGSPRVEFVRLPAAGSAETLGLDDYLGGREPDRRAARLEGLIKTASKLVKNDAPKVRAPSAEADPSGRPILDLENDRLLVMRTLKSGLLPRWDGSSVFNFGGALTRIIADDEAITIADPMTNGAIDTMIHATFQTIDDKGKPCNVTGATRDMLKADVRSWTTLRGIVRNPFVRPDGTVCTASGYDPDTKFLVALDEALEGMYVPEDPTTDEVAASVKLLTDEWLGDFPFFEQSDRANALAFLLTPFIRGSVPVVPLAVVDGLQMGVGKGLFADCVYLMLHGRPTSPTPWNAEEAEQRKTITSLFRTGADLFVYDEAHSISGAPLAQAITAPNWQDRILGVSTMCEFPNNVTWLSLGNNVSVHGDLRRRVYRIRIEPSMANPDRRPASSFRHPNIKEWTLANRATLLKAALTIVRAWYANGAEETTMADFGSFEKWQTTVGSILDNASVSGFLDNMQTWLESGDSNHTQWLRHYHWLIEKYPHGEKFVASDVARELTKMVISGQDELLPPGVEPKDGKIWPRDVGRRYGDNKGIIIDGMRMIRHTDAINRWHIETVGPDEPQDPKEFAPVPEIPPDEPTPEPVVESSEPVVFDLETNGLGVYSEKDFSRIVGYRLTDVVEVGTDHTPVTRAVQHGRPLVAHNGFQFDFHALAEHHGMDLLRASEDGLLWDTKVMAALADPPPYEMKPEHIEKHYSLNAVAERLGVPVKTDDIVRLAKEHGGFGAIPVDDEQYRDYCAGDVTSTVAVLDRLGTPTPYAMREFRLLGRLACSVTQKGFRVDTDLLMERLAENATKAAASKEWMDERYPMPTTRKDGSTTETPHKTDAGKDVIREAFRSLGANPDRWPVQGVKGASLGKEQLEWLHEMATENGKDDVAALCEVVMEWNGIRTVYQTVLDNMTDGRVHPVISARQASGRLSITDPGLTVFGKRNGRHIERAIFLPEPGHVIVAADLSQVDQRAVAALCQDPEYMKLFEPGRDAHTEVALAVWGTANRRDDAKIIGHGWNYGASPKRLAALKGVTYEAAVQFDQKMEQTYPDLVIWKDEVRGLAGTGELLDNGFGRKMRPDPARAYTQGPALMGQGAARDLMMEGILRLPLEVVPMMRAVVHDEVVFSIPEEIVRDVAESIRAAFTSEWRGVPILTDVSAAGSDWSKVYEH